MTQSQTEQLHSGNGDRGTRGVSREPNPSAVENRAFVAPPVDVLESEDEIVLVADLPGVAVQDLALRLEKDQLTLVAPRGATAFEPGFTYKRTFLVPREIDIERTRGREASADQGQDGLKRQVVSRGATSRRTAGTHPC
jgi:HSP20 family molecular chaperone IbpA